MPFRNVLCVTAEEIDLCNAVRSAIKLSGMKAREIAQRLEITEDRLGNIQSARTKVPLGMVDDLRSILQLPPEWPYTPGAISLVGGPPGTQLSVSPMRRIRVVGQVSAGPGVVNVDPDEEVYLYVPDRLAKLGSLAWTVQGDSMMPVLEPGDLAIFRESTQLRRRYAYLLKDEESQFCIKMARWNSAGRWEGYSLNPLYEAIDFANYQIQGMLVGWYRATGSRETLDSDSNGLILDID